MTEPNEIVIPLSDRGSLEEDAHLLELAIEKLREHAPAKMLTLSGKKIIEYNDGELSLLREVALFSKYLSKEIVILKKLDCSCPMKEKILSTEHLLTSDPIGFFVTLRRLKHRAAADHSLTCDKCRSSYNNFFNSVLSRCEKLEIVRYALPYLAGHKIGNRAIYHKILTHAERLPFSSTRFIVTQPAGRLLKEYSLPDGSQVKIFRAEGQIRNFYYLTPIEFMLSAEELAAIDDMKQRIIEKRPGSGTDFSRQFFIETAKDALLEFEKEKNITFPSSTIDRLAEIITRSMIGYGVLECLLYDDGIQDIYVMEGGKQLRLLHEFFDECDSNIQPADEELFSWASKLRLASGRPFDYANPVLDAILELPSITVRIASLHKPLSSGGISFSIRRHREKPWTYPLFISNSMMDPFSAGLLSFLVERGRAILIGGTRGAGKTSLLGASMFEIMQKYRIITIEDTLELPVEEMRKGGYDIVSLKVRSALSAEGGEPSPEDGIRAALRMGDSCLLVGEVRSGEAKILYEAMRVGALANFVGGTIHGDSPYGIFDRVVNDLGVPPASFKATDVIAIVKPIISPDGLKRYRRLMRITEVRKDWKDDPNDAFVDLMVYNPKKDTLEPTDILLEGDSVVLRSIGEEVREWRNDYNAILQHIEMRAKAKQRMVDVAAAYSAPEILECNFSISSNVAFHIFLENVREENGSADPSSAYMAWEDWLLSELRRRGGR